MCDLLRAKIVSEDSESSSIPCGKECRCTYFIVSLFLECSLASTRIRLSTLSDNEAVKKIASGPVTNTRELRRGTFFKSSLLKATAVTGVAS